MSFRPIGASSSVRAATRFRTSFARCESSERELSVLTDSRSAICLPTIERAGSEKARHCCRNGFWDRSSHRGLKTVECLRWRCELPTLPRDCLI